MRTSLIKRIAKRMIARDVVTLILASDSELAFNTARAQAPKGRSLKSMQEFDDRITYRLLWKMMQEGLIEGVGINYRIKYK